METATNPAEMTSLTFPLPRKGDNKETRGATTTNFKKQDNKDVKELPEVGIKR